jgi:hypothetical protein
MRPRFRMKPKTCNALLHTQTAVLKNDPANGVVIRIVVKASLTGELLSREPTPASAVLASSGFNSPAR